MAEESIDEILARLEGQGAFTPPADTTPRAVLADGTAATDYGSTANYLLGLSRSALAGPTFGLSKRIEAAVAAPFTDKTYSQELADINAQMRAFQQESPVSALGTEVGMGYALNPLGALGALGKGVPAGARIAEVLPSVATAAKTSDVAYDVLSGLKKAADVGETVLEKVPLARSAQTLITSVPGQAFTAGYLSADPTISSPLAEGGKSALVGSVLSGASDVLGKGLSSLARQSDRLTLSKYGLTATDVGRTLKKAAVAGKEVGREIKDVTDVPILNTIKELEGRGLINAEDDVINNIGKLGGYQDEVGYQLRDVLKDANDVAQPFPEFQTKYTDRFINNLRGKAREEAAKAAQEERAAIISQFEQGGSILDLQDSKVGLNYAWNTKPYTADVQKAIRADLREEIEKRIEDLVQQKRLPTSYARNVTDLNEQWGKAADLKDVFTKKAAKDLGGDVVEDFFLQTRTTGGPGSLTIASAASGSIIPAAIGQLANLARTTKGKEFLANTLKDPAYQKLGAKLGDLLQTYGTGKGYAQISSALSQAQKEKEAKGETALDRSISRGGGALNAQDYNDIMDILRKAPPPPKAQEAPTGGVVEKKNISANEDVKDLILQEPPFIQAIISVESKGNPNAKSPKGAEGLMQIMPATAKYLELEDPKNPRENIKAGKRYINQQTKSFGDRDIAIASYNWGPGNVSRALKQLEQKGVAQTWDNMKKYLKVPEETRAYVDLVKQAESQIASDPQAYWSQIFNRRQKQVKA